MIILDGAAPRREEIIVLGHDPGRDNYAYSVQRCWTNGAADTLGFEILETGVFTRNVREMTKLHISIQEFCEEQNAILSRLGVRPNVLGIERYQARQVNTSQLETVNVSLGAVFTHFMYRVPYEVSLYAMMPASWKNAVNRIGDLKKVYRYIALEPHELDATLIGQYAAYKYYKINPFSDLTKVRMLSIVHGIERQTTSKSSLKKFRLNKRIQK